MMETFEEYLKNKADIDPSTEHTVAAMLEDVWNHRQEEIEKLQNLFQITRETLEFYANSNKWGEFISTGGIFDEMDGDMLYAFDGDDCGFHAKRCLERMPKITRE